MKLAGFGRIINIISASVKIPLAGLGVSNTIRGAVAAWAKTLAAELGSFGITVNNALPGFTKTGRAYYVIAKNAADSGKTEAEVLASLEKEIPTRRIGRPEGVWRCLGFFMLPGSIVY
jgi:3-oxoacyl-[acyl-carrier protein] reductase